MNVLVTCDTFGLWPYDCTAYNLRARRAFSVIIQSIFMQYFITDEISC